MRRTPYLGAGVRRRARRGPWGGRLTGAALSTIPMGMESAQSTSGWLWGGAVGAWTVALLHVGIVLSGAPGYRFFGAGEELATLAEEGSWIPALVTLGLAFAFALSGAAAVLAPRVVWARPLAWIAAIVYVGRGLGVLAAPFVAERPLFVALSSLASLAIGAPLAAGLWRLRRPG